MKRKSVIRKLLLVAGCATLISAVDVGVGWCATSATATASGTVIAPISITKDTDLQFGKFMPGTIAGTVVVPPVGTRTAGGGAVLVPGIASTAAAFTVTGETGATYSITLPTDPILLSDGASHTMSVGAFMSTPDASGTLTGVTSGTGSIQVGATVTVGANQASGIYTNGTGLIVLVDYN